MSKKIALLVKTTFISRVIVDAPDDWDITNGNDLWIGNDIPLHSQLEDDVVNQTQAKLKECVEDESNVFENIEGILNDVECPVDSDDLK